MIITIMDNSKFLGILFFLCIYCGVVRSADKGLKNVELPDPEQNVMPFDPVHYSESNVSNNYLSVTKYNPKGMGHLYFITKRFMNFILKEQAYPNGAVRVENGRLVGSGWESVAWHYRGLVAVAASGLVLAALVPLLGLAFCCCRCAGKCGARPQSFDARYDSCRRHFFAFLLSVTTVAIMFGVVCAFVTNEQMEEGARALPRSVRTSIRDTNLYLNNTKQQVNTLLVTNFNELETSINQLLQRSGEIVKDRLGEISQATVLANLTRIVTGLKRIKTDLNNIDSLTKPLREHAIILESALREIREVLLSRLDTCKHERACLDFLSKYNITALSLEANFTQLPDVTTSLQNVSALLADNITDEVLKGKDQFDRIKYKIQNSVDHRIPEISREIKKAGRLLNDKAKNLIGILESIQDVVNKNSNKPVKQAEDFLKQYAHYRYYVGLGVSGCLLTVLCCLGLGLLCGYCGHRPDPVLYSDDCCDRATASTCLVLSVWLMLLTFSELMAVCIVSMVTGSVTDRVLCLSLRHPAEPNNAFSVLDQLVHLERYSSAEHAPPLSAIIQECHRNSSVYQVLGLDVEAVSNLSSAQLQVGERVRELANSIVINADIQIVTPQAERQLRALAASPLNSINLTAYTALLKDKITSIDLLQVSSALLQTKDRLPPSQSQVKNVLRNQAMYLEIHQERQVSKMVELSGWLHGNASLLSHHLRFNHSSLRHAVESLLASVFHAQAVLNSRGPSIVHKLAEEFGGELSRHVDTYLDRVEKEAYTNVGKCWPLSSVYNATVISTCNAIVDPFNGFWLSVGCVVLLFLPAIFFSVKLASLYQKSYPYAGTLGEADYLYEVYGDNRDNIPLAHVEKKKRKKKKSGGGNSGSSRYDNSVSYSAHLSRSERQASSAAQSLPPSQPVWEGGPPRYQGPSEYERPPPYYFPAAVQQPVPGNQG